MNTYIIMNDLVFAVIFSAIMLMAAIPNGLAFWKRVQNSNFDNMLKWQLLELGASADEIVQSILQRDERDFKSNRG